MGYVDEEGLFHSDGPAKQQSQQVIAAKQNGCIGCGCAGCFVVVIVFLIISSIIVSVLVFSANSMVDYMIENEDIIESQFAEHEDEIIDAMDDISDFMAGLEDAFSDGAPIG